MLRYDRVVKRTVALLAIAACAGAPPHHHRRRHHREPEPPKVLPPFDASVCRHLREHRDDVVEEVSSYTQGDDVQVCIVRAIGGWAEDTTYWMERVVPRDGEWVVVGADWQDVIRADDGATVSSTTLLERVEIAPGEVALRWTVHAVWKKQTKRAALEDHYIEVHLLRLGPDGELANILAYDSYLPHGDRLIYDGELITEETTMRVLDTRTAGIYDVALDTVDTTESGQWRGTREYQWNGTRYAEVKP
jgi:hypothetical protein